MDASEGAVETKQCPLCEKHIEISKFRMHDIGCSRSNYKCKECGQCVPKAEREEHEEEEHATVTCQNCFFSAPKYQYKDHEANCAMKPQTCPYCDKLVQHTELQDHLSVCGTKTYQCGVCESYVKNMDKASHQSSGACQANQDRKKKEEEQRQKAELERFQQERLREIEQKKRQEERRIREEEERKRIKEQKEKFMDANHGIDELDEFQGVNQYPANYNRQAKQSHNNQVSQQLRANKNQQQPAAARMPASSNLSKQPKPGVRMPSRPDQSNPVPQQMASRDRIGSRGPTGPNINQKSNAQPQPASSSRPINYNQQQQPQIQAPKSQVKKPSIKQTFTTKLGNLASKVSPKNRNANKQNGNQGTRQAAGSHQQQIRATENNNSSLANNQMQQNAAMNDDELNAALIQQMMEEDENEIMAQQLQNQAFGGGASNQASAFNFDEDAANVRQADQAQEEQLIGGYDHYRAPRQHRRHRNDPVHPPPQRMQQPDREISAIEAELDQIQRNNHSQVEFDQMVPGQQPGMGMNMGNQGYQPMQEQFSTEQQMINQVIEESLKAQQNMPSADYDEEAELRRILEASKNDH